MPLHDCPHSFDEIAQQVLPSLMARMTEQIAHPWKASCTVLAPNLIPQKRGAYVWVVEGQPIYVGIANQLRRRITDHLSDDPSRANLAVRMAAKQLGVAIAGVKKHPDFDTAFAQARDALARAELAFIEIENPLVLYFFEPYCAMQLDTSEFNRFDTLQILSPRPKREPQKTVSR